MISFIPSSNQVPPILQSLAEEALRALTAAGFELANFQATALHDERKDSIIKTLPSFTAAQSFLCEQPFVRDRFGDVQCDRFALQFVYQLFPRANDKGLLRDVHRLYRNFSAEARKPAWNYWGLANLRNFTLAGDVSGPVAFPDGVSIQGRSFQQIHRLGYSAAATDALSEDWMQGMGQSSYVIVVQRRVNKSPENLILTDATLILDAQRAVSALRLAGPGDIAMGPMWFTRSERFKVANGGLSRAGWQIPTPHGPHFQLTSQAIRHARILQPMLKRLDEHGYHGIPSPPVNLDLALRSFLATYDRFPHRPDSQLLDTITAAEALLSTATSEVTFRLAFRIAGLLGWTPKARAEIFESMKHFYDTRSRIVHGEVLGRKHSHALAQVEEVRDYLRRLLSAFVPVAAGSTPVYDRKFFETDLDIILQDEAARRRLIRDLKIRAT